MKINSHDFRAVPGKKVRLTDWPTLVKPFFETKSEYKELLEKHIEQLSSLQRLHYASNRYALPLIFQGMDAAGKDRVIRLVMSGVNPQGCQVSSFKEPGPEELEHDFLWRTTQRLPARRQIGIFNRAYAGLVVSQIVWDTLSNSKWIIREPPENGTRNRSPSESFSQKTKKRRTVAPSFDAILTSVRIFNSKDK